MWSRKNINLGKSFLFLFGLLVFFQNCGPQAAINSLQEPEVPHISDSNVGLIPFAFEYQPDMISYMSCSSSSFAMDPRFYTFKVGSYSTGSGLKLRQEYIDYITNNFTYKGSLDDQVIRDSLTYGKNHNGALIQLALRRSTPLFYSIINRPQLNTPPLSEAYNLMPSTSLPLTNKEFLPQLVDLFKGNIDPITTMGTSQIQTYPLETTLRWNWGPYTQTDARSLRTTLMTTTDNIKSYLTLSFSEDLATSASTDLFIARRASSPLSDNLIWGKGYSLTFAADGGGRTLSKQATLSSTTEVNLSETTAPAEPNVWNCNSTDYSLMIVSPRDAIVGDPASHCVPPDLTSASYNLELHNKIRLHLPESKWAILNVTDRCVVPIEKTILDAPSTPNYNSLPDCYGDRALFSIDYEDPTATCVESSKGTGQYTCADFVSFCFKQ